MSEILDARVSRYWGFNMENNASIKHPLLTDSRTIGSISSELLTGDYKLTSVQLTITRFYNTFAFKDSNDILYAANQYNLNNSFIMRLALDGNLSEPVTFNSGEGKPLLGTPNTTNVYVDISKDDLKTFNWVNPPVITKNSTLYIVYENFATGSNGVAVGAGWPYGLTYDPDYIFNWVVEPKYEPVPVPDPTIPPYGGPSDAKLMCGGSVTGIGVLVKNSAYFSCPKPPNQGYDKWEVSRTVIMMQNAPYVDIGYSFDDVSLSVYSIVKADDNVGSELIVKDTITYNNKQLVPGTGKPAVGNPGDENYEPAIPAEYDYLQPDQTKVIETKFSITYYELEKRNISESYQVEANAYQIYNQFLNIGAVYITNTAGPKSAYAIGRAQDAISIVEKDGWDTTPLRRFVDYNQKTIPFTSMGSGPQQFYSIDVDNTVQKIALKFYNSDVQNSIAAIHNLNLGLYNKTADLFLKVSIKPTEPSQFSYVFRINSNNINKSYVPDIILMEQENIMVSDLIYTNASISGGYCRAFRCTFKNHNTGTEVFQWVLDDVGANPQATYNGRILNDVQYRQLPSGIVMDLTIEPCFYYTDEYRSNGTLYPGCEIIIPQKFLKISDEDLVPHLVFPVLKSSTPYTPMMLPDVERYGYEFNSVISSSWFSLNSTFGININGYDLYLSEQDYWSNSYVTRHIIMNLGLFVLNKDGYNISNLHISPFITVMANTPYSFRIYANDSYTDTSLETMWYRPLAIKGEYLKYEESLKFMQFINKYKPLVNNQDWLVPDNISGMIINTEFWIQKANQLNNYVKNMQNWTTAVTNPAVLWLETEFEHYKGEYVIAELPYTTNPVGEYSIHKFVSPAPINNLKQIYRELLQGVSAYGKLATHNYLFNKKYTHNFLHKFTHNQITMRQDGV